MSRKTKWRETDAQKRAQKAEAALQRHARNFTHPSVPEQFTDFPAHLVARINTYRDYALRAPEDWVPRTKSKRIEARFLDLVKFVFGRYPVSSTLFNTWLENSNPCNFRFWYIVATQGGSLYKEATSPYLSKTETHHFLTAPLLVMTAERALWYAIARAQTDKSVVAGRIALSTLGRWDIRDAFNKDVARFLARNPLPTVHEIDDLLDYIASMREEDNTFSLKGRTLQSLVRRMHEWHRELAKRASVGGGSWDGLDLPDRSYHRGTKNKRALWHFRQIKTGDSLHKEGQKMRHCVTSYKSRCMQGTISIWSLTAEYPPGTPHKGLTIEIDNKSGRIVQARGYANRTPLGNEAAMVRCWATEYKLIWRG